MNHPYPRTWSASPMQLIALVVLCLFAADIGLARAQGGASCERTTSPSAASRRGFLRESYRALKAYDERLSDLATHVPEEPGPNPDGRDVVINLRMTAKSAEASYLNAKLNREVAEIAVSEYRDGTYLQELLTIEGEITLARSDLTRGRDLVQFARRDADKLWAQLEEAGRSLCLEAAELKKKALVEFAGPRRIKELEAQVAKARSGERAKRVTLEIVEKQLKKVENEVASIVPRSHTDHRRCVLVLIAQAIPIEVRIHAMLERFARETKSDEGLKNDIREQITELASTIEGAEAARDASEFDRLKSRLVRATRR